MTRVRKHVGITVAVLVAAAVGTATAVATQHRQAPSVYASFAVLKAHPTASWKHRARSADVVPSVGEALPAVSTAIASTIDQGVGFDGLTASTIVTLVAYTEGIQVYSFVAPNGDLCNIGLNPPGTTDGGGGGCSHASDAEVYGSTYAREAIDSNRTNTIIKIVPNGVKAVTFTTQGGGSVSVPVVNNVASYSSTEPFTASFTSPKSHEVVSDSVAAADGPAPGATLPQPIRPLTK